MTMSDAPPRTLADDLRARSDEALVVLLRARPDLGATPPADIGQLASRAASRPSVLWALDRLDTAHLSTLAAMAALEPPVSLDGLRRQVDADDARIAAMVARLHASALVWGRDGAWHVVREAREVLRTYGPRGPYDGPPPVRTREVDDRRHRNASAGTVMEVLQRLEHLLGSWGESPPPVLRSGGRGVRDVRNAATALGVTVDHVEFLLDLTESAGLLARAPDDGAGEVWAPTTLFDTWRDSPPAARWVAVATAWLAGPGRRVRTQVLRVLSSLDGAAYVDAEEVVEAVAWAVPRADADRDDLVRRTLVEATRLGVVTLDALSPAGAGLGLPDAAAVVEGLLPSRVDHVLVQADLTAVAPGPLEPAVRDRLEDVADVESRGGATVYRFTADSVRRALDRGWPASEIHAFVEQVSVTPIPQPLTYLVDDTARQHGRLRIGDASAYLRSDDPAELEALLADPTIGPMLHRIAPTVAVSTVRHEVLADRLSTAGHRPVGEEPGGVLRVRRRDQRRAEVVDAGVRRMGDPAEAVRAIRAGERAASLRPAGGRDEHQGSLATMAQLREAADAQEPVWVAYMDQAGTRTERVVEPLRVDAGWLTAFDHRSQRVQRFAVHRIVQVASAP
ncbi:helicase C-terminal domain-containing protein [Mumia sp. zg.B17]|uniref:helicase-associated domain-containing protein n=1 Tax=Mumia sp. zg.B17 TaxID=2855446 RepID=UPI001C6DD788|nr:helicase-associated domain-containing protein [Mumia sp. zg.B17]MBW9207016.1 helicase C-terminal domain-containing protein [Mumia sp. zg.B17]